MKKKQWRAFAYFLLGEYDQVEEQLARLFYRDPTEPQGKIVEDLINSGELLENDNDRLRREVSYLQSTVDALEMEKNSEKSDPIVRVSNFIGPGFYVWDGKAQEDATGYPGK